MKKIYNSSKDPFTGEVFMRVFPPHAPSLAAYLTANGIPFFTDNVVHTVPVSHIIFAATFNEILREKVTAWDAEIN